MDGIVILNKPSGISSHSACAKAAGIFGVKKRGHAGTLDYMAQGILVVLLGNTTRLSEYILASDKEYIAEIKFGIMSDTLDIWGKILQTDTPLISEAGLKETLNTFVGNSMQTPPMVSALKHKGRKLYDYARDGIVFDIPPRKIVIKEIELLSCDLPETALIRVKCSKGTYIRSLCKDIGEALGTLAVMGNLIRTRSGNYGLEDSFSLEALEQLKQNGNLPAAVRDADEAVDFMRRIDVKPGSCSKLMNGNTLNPGDLMSNISDFSEGELCRVYCGAEFSGIAAHSSGVVKPRKVFGKNRGRDNEDHNAN